MPYEVTIFKSINSHVPQYFEVEEVLNRIKRGTNKQLIEKIRTEKSKEVRDNLKKGLQWICFSGKFKKRLNEELIEHSGLICLDFDNFTNKQTLMNWHSRLKNDIHCFALFISPSGKGLKALFRVPKCSENDEHNSRFEAIGNYFKDCKFFDKNTKGVNRVCYESYDPDLYINTDAKIFTEIVYSVAVRKPVSVYTGEKGYDEAVHIFNNLIKWFESKYNLKKGNRNVNLLYLFSACKDYNIPEYIASNFVINYCIRAAEDFDSIEPEIEKIMRSAYSRPSSNKKMVYLPIEAKGKGEDDSIDDSDDFFYEEEVGLKKIEDSFFEELVKNLPEEFIFWQWDKGGYKINFLLLKQFLQDQGFFRYELSEKEFIFIRVVENTIKELDIRHIKDFLLRCLDKWDKPEIYNMIAENAKFRKDYINYLDPFNITWNKDTKDYGWAYFNNITVRVSSKSIDLVEYIDLDGFIWATKKLKRNFKLVPEDETNESDIAKFVANVCNGKQERIDSFRSGIGYLMHSFKSKSTVKAVILNDEALSMDDAMGGTGKGLTIQLIGTIKNVVIIPGADFNTGKDFAWQRINLDTDIVLIDDVEKNFKYKKIFTFLTDGWPVRKLYKDEIYLSPEDSPKVVVNTNYVIKGDSDSYARRKFELELYPHYNKQYQPIDDFGHEFITEWSEKEFNLADNYLLYCLKYYLQSGLKEPEYINLKYKKLIVNTSEDFTSFAESYIENDMKYNKRDLFNFFKETNGLKYSEFPTQKIFTHWMEYWCGYNDFTFNSRVGAGGIYFVIGAGGREFKQGTGLIF